MYRDGERSSRDLSVAGISFSYARRSQPHTFCLSYCESESALLRDHSQLSEPRLRLLLWPNLSSGREKKTQHHCNKIEKTRLSWSQPFSTMRAHFGKQEPHWIEKEPEAIGWAMTVPGPFYRSKAALVSSGPHLCQSSYDTFCPLLHYAQLCPHQPSINVPSLEGRAIYYRASPRSILVASGHQKG